jgi:transposase
MPRPRRFFPPEYKAEVVELIRTTGKTVGQVARELDLTETAVRTWVRQADLDAGRRSDGLTTAERDELRKLRREVRDLREEREILRKAAVFFASMPQCQDEVRPVGFARFFAAPACGWWLVRRCATPPGGSVRQPAWLDRSLPCAQLRRARLPGRTGLWSAEHREMP